MKFWLGISIEQPNIKGIIIRILLLTALGVALILAGLKWLLSNELIAIIGGIILLVLGILCFWVSLWKYYLKPKHTWEKLFSTNSDIRFGVVEKLAQKGHWYKIIPMVHALSDEDEWVRRLARNGFYKIAGLNSSEIGGLIPFRIKNPAVAISAIETVITLRYEQNINELVQIYLKNFEIKPIEVTTRYQYHEKGDDDRDLAMTGAHEVLTINANRIACFDEGMETIYLRDEGQFMIAKKTKLKSGSPWTENWSVDLVEINVNLVEDYLKERVVDALSLKLICKYLRKAEN